MEDSFTIRHYVPETDLSSLSRLLTEIESMDRDGEDTSEEYLRASLAWPNYHPDHDVWVAEAEGKLVGYGVALEQPSQNCTIYVVVHPLYRRKGLGSQLLALILSRRKSPLFLQYYDANDILLLFDEKDAILGVCSLKSQGKQEGSGEISDLLDGPGVVQEFREQGHQRPLVLAGIERLRQKGNRPITLEFWGDDENVLDIYRSLGFKMVNRYIAYHRELP